MSSKNHGPKTWWTLEELQTSSRVVFPNLDSQLLTADLDGALLAPRPLDPTRVYRTLLKFACYEAGVPQVRYTDAVMPECHNRSGLQRRGEARHPGHEVQHVCDPHRCRYSVRLVAVGREDLLYLTVSMWATFCRAQQLSTASVLIEQDAYVAQQQVRESQMRPLFVFDYLQLVAADSLARAVPDGAGGEVWQML